MYQNGRTVAADEQKAKSLARRTQAMFARAAAAGDPAGCDERVRAIGAEARSKDWTGNHDPGVNDLPKARAVREGCRRAAKKGCEAGDNRACVELAGYSRDDAERSRLLRPACDAGDLGACTALAHASTAGAPGGDRGLLEKACDGGWASACDSLATLVAFEAPDQAATYRARAKEWLQAACEANDDMACLRFARWLSQPEHDDERRRLLHRLCGAQVEDACGECRIHSLGDFCDSAAP